MKYYTLGDILFAFRDEYLKVYKDLEEIKGEVECVFPDKKLYVTLTKMHDNDPMDLSFVLDTGKRHNSGDRTLTEQGLLYDGREGKFYDKNYIFTKDKDKILAFLDKVNSSEFGREFAMCEPDSFKIRNNYELDNNLIVWPNLFEMASMEESQLYRGMYYRPYEDRVYFEKEGPFQHVNEKYVRDVLSEEIPEYLFRTYHKDIIENHEHRDFQVVSGRLNNKCNRYTIEENGKRLVLKR